MGVWVCVGVWAGKKKKKKKRTEAGPEGQVVEGVKKNREQRIKRDAGGAPGRR